MGLRPFVHAPGHDVLGPWYDKFSGFRAFDRSVKPEVLMRI